MWFLVVMGLALVIVWMYSTLASALSSINKKYQWTLILLAPVLREATNWAQLNACSKAQGRVLPNKPIIYHFNETRYAVFLSVILGGIATTESTYCLIAIDFLINIFNGLKIVKKSKAGLDG